MDTILYYKITEMTEQRINGRVKWFDSKKGYGFIKDNDSEKDIFLHVSTLEKSKLRVLKENQEIKFEIKEEKGKLQAVNLKRIKE